MAHRHRARKVSVLCRRQRAGSLWRRPRYPRHSRGHAEQARLGPDPRCRPHHRPGRADRAGRDLAGAGRAVRTVRRAGRDHPPDLPRGQRASGAGARDRRADGHPLPRARRQPEVVARRNAENAEIALRDHDELYAEGRYEGPRHDVPHLHHPGKSRLRERGGHAPQDAGVAEAAAAFDRSVRQFTLHRRQARTASRAGAATSGATPTTSAPACSTSASRRISALPIMSTGRSTFRCISSSATAATTT